MMQIGYTMMCEAHSAVGVMERPLVVTTHRAPDA